MEGGGGGVTEPKQAKWKAMERVRIDGCSIRRPTTDVSCEFQDMKDVRKCR